MYDLFSKFAVVYETPHKTRMLFSGSKTQCETFITKNPEVCGSEAFIQKLV